MPVARAVGRLAVAVRATPAAAAAGHLPWRTVSGLARCLHHADQGGVFLIPTTYRTRHPAVARPGRCDVGGAGDST